MAKIIMAIPKLPIHMDDYAKCEWFMPRFGESLGIEIASQVFSMINAHNENYKVGDDIVIDFEIVNLLNR